MRFINRFTRVFLCAALCVLFGASFAAHAEGSGAAAGDFAAYNKKLYGDADLDGDIDIGDVFLMRNALAGAAELNNSELADVDSDGSVNVSDVLSVRKYLAGEPSIWVGLRPDIRDFRPAAPRLTAESAADSITLHWNVDSPYDRVVLYDGKGAVLGEFDSSKAEYTAAGLTVATKYAFSAIAATENEYGRFESEKTEITAATRLLTPDTWANGTSASQVAISWHENSTYERVEVYYADIGEDNWVHYTTVGGAECPVFINGLEAGKRYDLKVRAFATVNGTEFSSDYSVKHYATTRPGNIPSIAVKSKNDNSITLAWDAADAAQTYEIYRSSSQNGSYSRITAVSGTTYTDKNLKDETTYFYKVRSYMTIGTTPYAGAYSKIVSAKTDNRIYYQTVKYGTSYMGQALTAYIFNPNSTKTLFCDFAVHGFEDEYYRDGQVLVNCAKNIINYYNEHIGELKGWRLVIVPCANPDGTYKGTNNQRAQATAFGRCTANHVDMNRDFKSGGFKAKESDALRNLIVKYKPTYYINFHGWLDTTLGDSTIGSAFRSALGLSGNQDGQYGADKGYIIGWVKNNVRAKACLVEFKNPSNANYKKVITGLNKLMK